MRSSTKALLTGLIATLTLANAISTAGARRIELSSQRFLAIWQPLTFEGGGLVIRCNVTMEGSFHSRTFSKVCGELVGYITEGATARPCVGGNVWMLNSTERLPNGTTTANTLPWHIRYSSFTGNLPQISALNIQFAAGTFLVEALGQSCTYAANTASPFTGAINAEAAGTAIGMTAGGAGPLIGGGFCPMIGSIEGPTIRLGRQPEAGEREYKPITVRLVQ